MSEVIHAAYFTCNMCTLQCLLSMCKIYSSFALTRICQYNIMLIKEEKALLCANL